MRCLITGAAGFIGSHLLSRLVADGHEVVGLDDLSAGSVENLDPAHRSSLHIGDIRDEAQVQQLAAGCDVIFHEAAVRSVYRSMGEPHLVTDVNVMGTLNVLEAARFHGCRVVFASSSSVYGDQPSMPLVETQVPMPRSPYAGSKLAGEVFCSTYWRAFGVPTVALRYFNVYGPRQDPSGPYALVVPLFIEACVSMNRPVVHGTGEQARDFTYIDDVVDATVLAAVAGERAFGRSFNIGGGATPTSVLDLLAEIKRLTGSDVEAAHGEKRPGDVMRTEADIRQATEILGYRPAVDLPQGLRHTVDWHLASSGRS